MHERGIRPLRRFWAFINRQPKVGQVLLVTFFIVMWVMAGTKPGGGAGRPALPETQINGTPVGRDVLVAPWSKGGAIKDTNRQMLCKTHNRAKGNR